jgi:hypothetical protein
MQTANRHPQQPAPRRAVVRPALVLVLAILLVAPLAFALGSRQDDRPPRKAKNLNQAPTLSFARGTLQRDGYRGWLLDQHRVVFTRDSRVTDKLSPGEPAVPSEGRIAIVSGPKVGGVLVVREATLLDPWANVEVNVVVPLGAETETFSEVSDGTPR